MAKEKNRIISFVLVIAALITLFGCEKNWKASSDDSVSDSTVTDPAESTKKEETETHGNTDYSKKELEYEKIEDTIKKVGRVEKTKNGLSMDWGASGIIFNADCEGDIYVRFAASNASVYLSVVIDGEIVLRISTGESEKIDSTNKRFRIASGLEKGVHTIEFYRSNGPQVGRFFLRSVEICGELCAPPENKYLIGFIGDSLSAGVGVYGKSTDPAIEGVKDANEDSLAAYPYLTARALDCDISTACISGVGLVAGTIGDYYAMTKIYELTCWHRSKDSVWDFPRAADLVVINLGTNDAGNLYNFGLSVADFKNGIRSFIATVQEKNAGCKIVWAYGLMTMKYAEYIQEAVAELNGINGNEIYFCELPLGTSGGGAHPSVEEQKAAAEVLTEFIRNNVIK